LLCLVAAACRPPAIDPVEGGIYSAVSDPQKGTYGIVKVLKIEIAAVHVRLYAGEHKARPTQVNPSDLKIGRADDGGGIGHLPLSHRVFAAWKPVFITTAAVDASELDGYDEWKKAGGGVWDE
jgi:hypothetical protein